MTPDGADGVSRRAGVLAAAVLFGLFAIRVTDVVGASGPVSAKALLQLSFTVALFVVPVLCAFAGTREWLAHRRWLVLAVQAVLTWVPFAVFGADWQVGIGGLLAGLVLLSFPGWMPWLAAGGLLAADVAVRVTVTGLPPPFAPNWTGALWAVFTFVDDTAIVFGMIRLAQLVGDLHEARGRAAGFAVTAERLEAAEALRSAVGERLDAIAAAAAAARRVLPGDPAAARARVTEAGAAAREAVAQARAVTVGRRGTPRPEPAAPPPGGAVIGARLGWAVLVVVLCAYGGAVLNDAALDHLGPRLMSLLAVGSVLAMGLQLYHSWAVRQGGRPRAWPFTLGLQAALAYAFFLPPIAAYFPMALFLAGSVLLLVPGRWRWAGFAAVVASWAALYATVPLHGFTPSDRGALEVLYQAVGVAGTGLLVYGLSRMARMARELEALRDRLASAAMVRERLRVARDVHDLLGLGLSAIALKTDLAGKLIGRDNVRADAEIGEMSRICAAVRADIRLVTHDGQRLSLAAELTAARQILTSADITVHASMPGGPLPAAADAVLAPVLREAVTNILRHSAATSCTIEAAAGSAVRLAVGNDGAPDRPDARGGSGLANLAARVRAAGGRLSVCHADGRFELTAEVPLNDAAELSTVSASALALHPPSPVQGQPAGSQ